MGGGGGGFFFFQAEDGIRDLVRSRGLGDVYKRQAVLLPPPDREDNKANAARVVIASRSLAVTILGDKAFAPVRQMAEAMGYKVDWNSENRTVKIM